MRVLSHEWAPNGDMIATVAREDGVVKQCRRHDGLWYMANSGYPIGHHSREALEAYWIREEWYRTDREALEVRDRVRKMTESK